MPQLTRKLWITKGKSVIVCAFRPFRAKYCGSVFIASYFEKQNDHGLRISISRSEPQNIAVDGKLTIFVPEQSLLSDYKRGRIDTQGYIARKTASGLCIEIL